MFGLNVWAYLCINYQVSFKTFTSSAHVCFHFDDLGGSWHNAYYSYSYRLHSIRAVLLFLRVSVQFRRSLVCAGGNIFPHHNADWSQECFCWDILLGCWIDLSGIVVVNNVRGGSYLLNLRKPFFWFFICSFSFN